MQESFKARLKRANAQVCNAQTADGPVEESVATGCEGQSQGWPAQWNQGSAWTAKEQSSQGWPAQWNQGSAWTTKEQS